MLTSPTACGDTSTWIVLSDQRAYALACDFPDPAALTASISGPAVTQSLDVLSAIPMPGFDMGSAQRGVVWNATCDLLTEQMYTLTIEDGQGNRAQTVFTLKP